MQKDNVLKKFSEDKRRWLFHCALLTLIYVLVIIFLLRFKYAYGSKLDWAGQHYAFPDYFRKLFYDTGNLFPSFAANIGAGENIYNFSYYGLYSPIVWFSYLLPFVPMAVYMQAVSIIGLWVSIILFYRFMRSKFSPEASLLLSLVFMCASPFIFHSHRHTMFVNYLPFLILAFGAVDNYFEKNKKAGLIIWPFMIILCSYFFSVSALIAIALYGICRWLQFNEVFEIKKFLRDAFAFAGRLFTAVLMAGIMLLPTAATLLSGRDSNNVNVDLSSFIPNVRLDYLSYSTYAMGLSCFALFSIVAAVLSKDRGRRFLGIVFALILTFPVFVYLLNGTLYFDAKALIPFVPLAILLMGDTYTELCESKKPCLAVCIITLVAFAVGDIFFDGRKSAFIFMNIDFVLLAICLLLFYKIKKKAFLCIGIAAVQFCSMLTFNSNEQFITIENLNFENSKAFSAMTDIIAQDEDMVRSSTSSYRADTVNMIYGIDYYSPYVYSSIHHKGYNSFYFDDIRNENEFRNSALTTRSSNILFDIFMGNRYLIADNNDVQTGYERVFSRDGLNLYKNKYAMPIGRSSSQLISMQEYERLSQPQRMEALVNCIVVDDEEVVGKFESTVEAYGDILLPKSDKISPTDVGYRICSDEDFKVSVSLDEKISADRIMVVEFYVDNKTGVKADVKIKINGIKNTLTDPSWKYYNNNTAFDYVLTAGSDESFDKLDITFGSGDYSISEIKAFTMQYPTTACTVDKLEVDKTLTKGDVIAGKINCSEDGYFELTVPYDSGFKITVDGCKQEYECVDKTFIGFPIKQGEHEIVIEYKAPMFNMGALMSAAGFAVCVVMLIFDVREKKRSHRSDE